VAKWSSISFNTSNVVFDGVIGGGPGNWNTGFGFEITRTTSTCGFNGSLIAFPGMVSNITIRHTRMYSGSKNYPLAGIKGVNGANGLTFSRVSIHTIFGVPFHMKDWQNVVIEYSYIADNRSTGHTDAYCPDWHAEGISSIGTNRNLTIRYNLWHKVTGTAVIAGVNNGRSEYWKIYGNIFSGGVTTIYYYASGNDQQVMTGLQFYNNTICGMPGSSMGGLVMQAGSNNKVYNNIWYNNIANSFSISGTHDYNYFSNNRRVQGCNPVCDKNQDGAGPEAHSQVTSTNPFKAWTGTTDPADANLSLNVPTAAGMTLAAEFKYDMYGNERGADGVWDRGAVEYSKTNIERRTPAYSPRGQAPNVERRMPLTINDGLVYNSFGQVVDRAKGFKAGVYYIKVGTSYHKLVFIPR
jgi:hypothetical protein